MTPTTVWAVYFSGTGTTERTVTHIAGELARLLAAPCRSLHFTRPQVRQQELDFCQSDLVVLGTPVYAGRVPNLLIKYVASVQGGGALAVPVVCYGNRNYDDALSELRLTLTAGGFHPVAGAAFSCQHSFSLTQGAGRPDISDLTIAAGFADQVYHKVEALPSADACPPLFVKGNDPVGPYYTPRDRHGNPINILPVKPKTKDTCTQCGRCAKECPLEAIDPADAHNIVGKCMKCNRCVRHCPKHAKYFDDPNYLYHKTELDEQYTWPRKEPELFL
mgnify:FL=1